MGVTIYDLWGPREGRSSLRRLPAVTLDASRLVWAGASRDVVVVLVLQIVTAVGVTGQLLTTNVVLRQLTINDVHGVTVGLLGAVAGLLVATAAVGSIEIIAEGRRQLLEERMSQYVEGRILATASTLDLVAFDSPALHDRLQRVSMSASYGPLQLVQGLFKLGSGGFGVLGVAIGLAALEPLLLPTAALAIVPLWFASSRRGRLSYEFVSAVTPSERERGYLYDLLASRAPAKEVRAFSAAGWIRERWTRLSEARLAALQGVVRRQLRLSLLGSLGSALGLAITLGWLIWLLASGRMSLAEAGAAATALFLLGSRLQSVGSGSDALFESAPFVHDLSTFIRPASSAHPARRLTMTPPGLDRISVENISFTYPSASRPALDGVSLELRAGEVVALVGENGSGKTTLAKLLSGLYVPSSGTVRWDGVDIARVDLERLRASVAVLFQDFMRYTLLARENIGLGRCERLSDLAAVMAAARQAGAHDVLASLRNGYDTLLGPEFHGGTDLSTGQWQRVALARALFRDAPLLILDEPTASLDARGEYELFARIREVFSGRTVLLISHRFSSVRAADRIYVLRDGRIAESGTHDDLMAMSGLYAELYKLQLSSYA